MSRIIKPSLAESQRQLISVRIPIFMWKCLIWAHTSIWSVTSRRIFYVWHQPFLKIVAEGSIKKQMIYFWLIFSTVKVTAGSAAAWYLYFRQKYALLSKFWNVLTKQSFSCLTTCQWRQQRKRDVIGRQVTSKDPILWYMLIAISRSLTRIMCQKAIVI